MPKVKATCKNCSTEFSYYNTTAHKGEYCSRKCSDSHRPRWNKGTKGLTVAWNKGLTGEEYSKHFKDGFSNAMKGKIPWNKGRKETRQDVLQRQSDSHYEGKLPRYKGFSKEAWRQRARRIMKVTDPNLDVHHIDGDWTNNNIVNLKIMTHSDHAKLHNPKGIK